MNLVKIERYEHKQKLVGRAKIATYTDALFAGLDADNAWGFFRGKDFFEVDPNKIMPHKKIGVVKIRPTNQYGSSISGRSSYYVTYDPDNAETHDSIRVVWATTVDNYDAVTQFKKTQIIPANVI